MIDSQGSEVFRQEVRANLSGNAWIDTVAPVAIGPYILAASSTSTGNPILHSVGVDFEVSYDAPLPPPPPPEDKGDGGFLGIGGDGFFGDLKTVLTVGAVLVGGVLVVGLIRDIRGLGGIPGFGQEVEVIQLGPGTGADMGKDRKAITGKLLAVGGLALLLLLLWKGKGVAAGPKFELLQIVDTVEPTPRRGEIRAIYPPHSSQNSADEYLYDVLIYGDPIQVVIPFYESQLVPVVAGPPAPTIAASLYGGGLQRQLDLSALLKNTKSWN